MKTQMEVQHFTGKVIADVEYQAVDKVGMEYGEGKTEITILSIKSPTTGWDMMQFDGIAQGELERIKLVIAEAEAAQAVAA